MGRFVASINIGADSIDAVIESPSANEARAAAKAWAERIGMHEDDLMLRAQTPDILVFSGRAWLAGGDDAPLDLGAVSP